MQEITTYDVIITATDESNIASTLEVNVVDPNVQSIIDDNSNSEDDTSSDDNSLLPSISMIATISVALAGAALIRRDEE